MRVRTHQEYLDVPISSQQKRAIQRRIQPVERGDGTHCWLWNGQRMHGAAFVWIDKQRYMLRRLLVAKRYRHLPHAYLLWTCREDRCVNPEHCDPARIWKAALPRELERASNLAACPPEVMAAIQQDQQAAVDLVRQGLQECPRGHLMRLGALRCRSCKQSYDARRRHGQGSAVPAWRQLRDGTA